MYFDQKVEIFLFFILKEYGCKIMVKIVGLNSKNCRSYGGRINRAQIFGMPGQV